MAEYIKEKWSEDFPDRAGQEVRPAEAVENTLDYDVLFPQYLSEDPVVFNQQNRTVSQLVSNDARLYERISATAADINAHLTDSKAHASGISGNAASASKLQTGRKIHRVLFDGTRDITLPDFSGCGEKTAGQSGMVPSPSAGKLNTVLHSNGSWGKVTYADMDEEAVAKIQACPFPVNAIYISADGKNPATYWPGTTWVAFAMGRCLIGAGAADSGTMYKAGDKLGEEKHTSTLAEIPIHGHTGKTGDAGNHNHDRGNMNITGAFWGRDVQSGYNGNGAFFISGRGNWNDEGGSYHDNYPSVMSFEAARSWSGRTSANGSHAHSFTTENAGGGQPHNNMQPSIVVYMFQRTG
ncbi:phage baseplate protein [Megasphaera sp.]|uniref:phage baseplate protein n=1 Tax=Megasphaera sp. TaxID=2023260 RepID=UPI00402A1C64